MASLEGTDFHAWIATNSPGEPVCLGGSDGGYSITAYPDAEGRIIGVLISTEDGTYVEAIGWVPAEEFMETLEFYEQ